MDRENYFYNSFESPRTFDREQMMRFRSHQNRRFGDDMDFFYNGDFSRHVDYEPFRFMSRDRMSNDFARFRNFRDEYNRDFNRNGMTYDQSFRNQMEREQHQREQMERDQYFRDQMERDQQYNNQMNYFDNDFYNNNDY